MKKCETCEGEGNLLQYFKNMRWHFAISRYQPEKPVDGRRPLLEIPPESETRLAPCYECRGSGLTPSDKDEKSNVEYAEWLAMTRQN